MKGIVFGKILGILFLLCGIYFLISFRILKGNEGGIIQMRYPTIENATALEIRQGGESNKTHPVKCREDLDINLKLNRTIIPQRFWENIPIREYKDCGINSLIFPDFNKSTNYWMIFLVKSAPNHYMYRETIRQTWAQVSEISNKKFLTLFLLGKPENEKQQVLLQAEHEAYGDILQCDLRDNYHNLTTKVLSTFRWLLEMKVQSSYYSFCDDDTTMNIANIFVYFNEMSRRNTSHVTICGFKHHRRAGVFRNPKSKWFMSPDIYNTATYPTFCHGAMWTVTPTILNDIYCMARVTDSQEFYLDDVYVTGILRHKISKDEGLIQPAKLDNSHVELMYYIWKESDAKYKDLQKVWTKWKKLLSSSNQPLKESNIWISPEEIKYKIINESLSDEIEMKWHNL